MANSLFNEQMHEAVQMGHRQGPHILFLIFKDYARCKNMRRHVHVVRPVLKPTTLVTFPHSSDDPQRDGD